MTDAGMVAPCLCRGVRGAKFGDMLVKCSKCGGYRAAEKPLRPVTFHRATPDMPPPKRSFWRWLRDWLAQP